MKDGVDINRYPPLIVQIFYFTSLHKELHAAIKLHAKDIEQQ